MANLLESLNRFIWGIPALLMILGVGIYLSIRTRFAQLTLFPKAMGYFFKSLWNRTDQDTEISSYQSLCTALAATVGTGNLAGVAGAIAIGGPGAIFWMWLCGLLGMVTKFAEATLSVAFRKVRSNGEYSGGPMYMIRYGMGSRWSWLAVVYCVFGIIAAFGVGNATQINAVMDGIHATADFFGKPIGQTTHVIIGIFLAIMVAYMLSGGMKRIGKIAERLVPVAALFYLVICIIALFLRSYMIPKAFRSIIVGAFSPNAVTGGVIGSVFIALRVGAARGVFTNEAGMGTASIAHASANVQHPVEQGLMGIVEVFWTQLLSVL